MSDVSHSITILNRLVTWTDRGIELEADPRHVDLLLNEVGCEGAKVTTPLVKERVEEALNAEDLDEELCGFVSLSKYATSLSVTRSARSFSSWKRAGNRSEATDSRTFPNPEARRLLSESQSTFASSILNQTQFTNLELRVDADHAGSIRSRKSTTGTALQLGKCTIPTTCKSQAVIDRRLHGCHDGTFDRVQTWIRKGQAY